jgi:putative transposase
MAIMARIARVIAVGYPHHITQRGNNRQAVFSNDSDKEKYLTLIKTHSEKYNLEILAYCLMTNHVHFIVVPKEDVSISNTFNYAHMRYSQYFNKKKNMCGHLWQGRFYSCIMDKNHIYAGVRYIERNPVRARLVKEPWQYTWSSAKIHCGVEKEDAIGVQKLFKYTELDKDWKQFISSQDNKEEIDLFRSSTLKGIPLGDNKFVVKLEKMLNRVLHIKPVGRPKY